MEEPRGARPRTLGMVGAAILEPDRIGPFRIPDLATVAAIVAIQIVAGMLLVRLGLPDVVQIVALALLTAVGATEVFLRARHPRSRLAFEAMSWLGEQELAAARAQTGEPVPLTAPAAAAWLQRHPDRPEERWIRAEVLAMAGRLDEALEAARGIPVATPSDEVMRLATIELVDWLRGGGDDLTDLVAAVGALPPGSDDRLRAEVMLAVARVRLRTVDGRTAPREASQPLIDARATLGRRADGQIGRALRRPVLRVLLLVGGVFSLVQLLLATPGATPGS